MQGMTNTDNEHPPAWKAALSRFRDAYGHEFDRADDTTDIWLLVQLLEEEIHRKITSELVESFNRATARIKEQMRALELEQKR
jgi:hypothetical protein